MHSSQQTCDDDVLYVCLPFEIHPSVSQLFHVNKPEK